MKKKELHSEDQFSDQAGEQLTWATKLNYGVGAMGKSLSNQITVKTRFFYENVLHLHLGFLSVLYFLGRIWDGVNDLLMGTVIDNTRGKYGKFRPWIVLGALTNAVVTVAMFWQPSFRSHTALLAVWVAFFYVLWDMTYTMVDVGYWAMIPALSMEQKQRDQLSMIPRIFAGPASIIGAFSNKIYETIGGGQEPSQMARGIFTCAIISSGVYILTSLYSAAKVKEPGIDTPKINQEKFSLRKAASILLHNDQALVIVGVMILFNWANNLTGSGMDNHFFWELGGPEALTQQGFFNIITGAGSTIGLFVFPLVSRWFGRKRVYAGSFLVPCLGYLAMALVDRFAPGSFLPLAVSGLVAYVGYGSMSVMQGVMLADAVDYGEYTTGVRNEGIIFSTLTMLSKLAKAFSDLTGTVIASVTKFGGQHANTATPLAIRGFKMTMYQIPPLLLLLALLLYLRKFRLHPARVEEIQGELKARKAALAVEIESGTAD
ncbi:MAG: glycoside-pentoside-hexuronide (GPH):cation symporter [Oscillospiraceae bacterium]|jgi:melibiose permease|nr:glycoside-pentoside-hexuronide (GPH):cation symporter [Oscillospiraceae bacterium]